MRAGSFNINSYLERLYENAEDGNLSDKEGLIIPDENKKTYDWLKKEYQAGQTEVKVEISGSGSSFKPGYDLQTSMDSVKDFKPGMFGEVKTADTGVSSTKPGEKTSDGKAPLDAKQGNPNFGKDEGNKPTASKTNSDKGDIKNNNFAKKDETEEKDGEEKEDNAEKSSAKPTVGEKKPEVKKIDLKTKKK